MQVKKSNKKIDLSNLSKKRKVTKINIYKVANFKNVPKIKQRKIFQRKSPSKKQIKKIERGLKNERKYKEKSEKKTLKHEKKINKQNAEKVKFQYRNYKNKLLYNKVKPVTGTLKTISRKILKHNEDDNTATEGVFKTTYTTSKALSSKIRSKGKKLTKKIKKKSNKISKIKKKENKNKLFKNNLYNDKKFNQERLFNRILHQNIYYTKYKINSKVNSIKNFFIELPGKFLGYIIKTMISFVSFFGIIILSIITLFIIISLIFGNTANNKNLNINYNDDIKYNSKVIYPAEGSITSPFGWRDGFYLQDGSYLPKNFHKGIDIANQLGTSIKAMSDGIVIFAGWNDYGYGNLIIIDHDNGITTRYAHLNTINVNIGQKVLIGEEIGIMGTTGWSTGVHLHFEVRINNDPIDPKKFIDNTLRELKQQKERGNNVRN